MAILMAAYGTILPYRHWLWGGIPILVLVLAGTPVAAAQVRVGQPFPELSVTDWNGEATGLGALQEKVVVVDFWASWCAPCRTALPALSQLAERHAAAGLRVYAVNIDKKRRVAESFLATYLPDPKLTLLADPGGREMARLGAPGMPTLYVISAGKVQAIEHGYSPEQGMALEALIAELLAVGD